jgi:hypothetical protein
MSCKAMRLKIIRQTPQTVVRQNSGVFLDGTSPAAGVYTLSQQARGLLYEFYQGGRINTEPYQKEG